MFATRDPRRTAARCIVGCTHISIFSHCTNFLCLNHEVELHSASSAAVKRLFSAFTQVLTARRCLMQDKTRYMHIFLRSIDHWPRKIPPLLSALELIASARFCRSYATAKSQSPSDVKVHWSYVRVRRRQRSTAAAAAAAAADALT